MLIQQIIKFELRGLGPPGLICTPTTGYFYDKQKSLRKIFKCIIILLKYCSGQCTLLFSTWAKSLTKFNLKMQDVKRVLDFNSK